MTEEKVALGERGLSLHTVYQTYRRDGSLSFTVYRVEETGREEGFVMVIVMVLSF